jgi:sigma-B regulation protein RsbU (phosphoserine phosphatase)
MSEAVVELRFPAEPRQLKKVRAEVRKQAVDAGCDERVANDITMAVDEACQNIIRHAYGAERKGDIVLRIDREDEELVFSLLDFAPRVDPAKVKPRDLDDVRPGGLGTFLIREVMDSAEFVEPPPGCGNLLRMVKRVG